MSEFDDRVKANIEQRKIAARRRLLVLLPRRILEEIGKLGEISGFESRPWNMNRPELILWLARHWDEEEVRKAINNNIERMFENTKERPKP
jgi:hypothetical protein